MTPAVLTFIAYVCGQDLATGAWTRDCGPYEERAADQKDCAEMAKWLHSTSPAGVRVLDWDCRPMRPIVAQGAKR